MKFKVNLILISVFVLSRSFGQSLVTTGGQKYTLIEEATGAWCQTCPDGAQWLQEKIEPDYARVIVASFHDDHGGNPAADAMTIAGNPFNTSLPNGTGYVTAFPMGSVDRVPLGGNVGLDRTQWYSAAGARNGVAPAFDVTMTSVYDPTTRIVQIRLMAKALTPGTGTWRANAYITEDSIASDGTGYGQISEYTGATAMSSTGSLSWYAGHGSPIAPSSLYAHMDVVRAILPANADRIWGDVSAAFVNPNPGDTVVANYSYTIPATSSDTYTKVVGLVQKYGGLTSNRAIENCIMARVRSMSKDMLKTNEVAQETAAVILSPNPASDQINVQCSFNTLVAQPTKVTITNIAGQIVSQKEYIAGGSLFMERISLDNIRSGSYYMILSRGGTNITTPLTIHR